MFFCQDKILNLFTKLSFEYPNNFSFESIGNSVQKKSIYCCTILPKKEKRYSILFVGGIHGNEVPSIMICKNLIQYLCRHSEILQNTIVHVIPVLNPDGYGYICPEKNIWMPKRENANDIDLNRNFPHAKNCNCQNETTMYEPETIAMMEWSKKKNLNLSISFHSGDLGINTSYDYGVSGVENKTTNDILFQYFAEIFVSHHPFMNVKSPFPNGITNGAKWYAIEGSMGDWRYDYTNVIELTIEISPNNFPSKKEMQEIWQCNKIPIIKMIKVFDS